jgi:hypothetical protein
VSHLRWVLVLGGFALALLGVVLADQRLVWAAIAMLLSSLLVSLVLRKRGSGNSAPPG